MNNKRIYNSSSIYLQTEAERQPTQTAHGNLKQNGKPRVDSGVGLLPLSLRATVAMGAILLAAATFPYTSHGPSAKSTQIREIKYRSSDDRRAEEKDKRDGGGLME